MEYINKITIFLLLFFLTISCTEIVPNKFPDFPGVPTINSILVEGDSLLVQISFTGGLDSLVLPMVDNATVDLFVDHVFSEQLKPIEDGMYVSSSKVEAGKEYTCKVVLPGFDTLVCAQSIPLPKPILKVKYISSAGIDEYGDDYSSTIVTFRNDPQVPLYFEVDLVETNRSDLSDIPKYLLRNTQSMMSEITDPVLLNEGIQIALFSNELIKDSIYTMTLNYSGGESGSYSFLVELRSVTYDYYRYQKQYYLYGEGKYADITSKTTAFPLYSNIENAYGIFAGYSISVSDTITPLTNGLD